MDADIYKLYESGFFRILDFKCRCKNGSNSKPEYSSSFSISFVRKGNFLFNDFRNSLDSYTGSILVTKPFFERTVSHIHEVPDECTIIEFKDEFYLKFLDVHGKTRFFTDNDIHSTLVKADVELEFLHSVLLQLLLNKNNVKLRIDDLVFEIINKAISNSFEYKPEAMLKSGLKKHHLKTIESAKEYINRNFMNDISLKEISESCCISPFHFSRIFKAFTASAPYNYLLNTRLKNAELLMRHTEKPITEIAFSSGFNSLENFISAFRNYYKYSPRNYRLHEIQNFPYKL